jgi:hypothetical protein
MDIFCFEFDLQVYRWHMILRIENCWIFTRLSKSWVKNEDKNVNIESTKKHLKIGCPICKDEIKLQTSTICGHIFCQECIYGIINTQNKRPICQKKLNLKNVHCVYIQFNFK